jgi:hypothetical protein
MASRVPVWMKDAGGEAAEVLVINCEDAAKAVKMFRRFSKRPGNKRS